MVGLGLALLRAINKQSTEGGRRKRKKKK